MILLLLSLLFLLLLLFFFFLLLLLLFFHHFLTSALTLLPLCAILPMVGLSDATPQKAAGIRTLPPTSVPTPSGEPPRASRQASPPVEPPGVRLLEEGKVKMAIFKIKLCNAVLEITFCT